MTYPRDTMLMVLTVIMCLAVSLLPYVRLS